MIGTLDEILEDLAALDGWEQRYEYVIDLGRTLPEFPGSERTEANLVRGCTSTVYMTLEWHGIRNSKTLAVQLTSDALIVNGLLAIVYAAYNKKSPKEALVVDLPGRLAATSLLEHLSPNRRHGFASVIERINKFLAV